MTPVIYPLKCCSPNVLKIIPVLNFNFKCDFKKVLGTLGMSIWTWPCFDPLKPETVSLDLIGIQNSYLDFK